MPRAPPQFHSGRKGAAESSPGICTRKQMTMVAKECSLHGPGVTDSSELHKAGAGTESCATAENVYKASLVL